MTNKGVFVQCGGCGFTKHISLEGTPEEIEERIHQTIGVEGWRWTKIWQGYICSACRISRADPLYAAATGLKTNKIRGSSKVRSYEILLYDVARQLKSFMKFEREYGNG